eukprot:3963924-Lingulodinium_polyedra.AAC.1
MVRAATAAAGTGARGIVGARPPAALGSPPAQRLRLSGQRPPRSRAASPLPQAAWSVATSLAMAAATPRACSAES